MIDPAAVADVRATPRPAARAGRLVRPCSWLFALALFGYPIVGNVISLLQIDSRALSVPFRIAVAIFSAGIFLASGRLRIDRMRLMMIVLWSLYTLRLLHDWFWANLDGADYALQFFIACSVLPALALIKADAFRPRHFAAISFLVASAGTLTSLLANIFGGSDVQDVTEMSGRLSLAALDPVSLGHLSVSALLCGAVLWRGSNRTTKIVLLWASAALLWCLILTGSKGPTFALVACLGLWAWRRGILWRFAFLALPLLVWLVASEGNPLAARLASSSEDESTGDRFVVLTDSIDQIAGSPLVGSAFVELNSGYYPHNVFVEAGLALGIPGALLFAGLVLYASVKAWKTLDTTNDFLGLLFFQGLFSAAISGSLFGSTLLWIVLAIIPVSTVSRPVPRNQDAPSGLPGPVMAPRRPV